MRIDPARECEHAAGVEHLRRSAHLFDDPAVADGDIHRLGVDAAERVDDAGVFDQEFAHDFAPCIRAYMRVRTSSSEG
ncbi:hypothetical protein DSECCO2_475620 [anaerobic digester metagenome]